MVLTGGRGEIATAIQAYATKNDWRVNIVERGDDLEEAVNGAQAILVLDVARPLAEASDYRTALRAVAATLEDFAVDHVASVTMLPADEGARMAFLEAANKAEAEFRAAHPKLTPIRCSVVVGTLNLEGPSDAVIRANGPAKLVPGDGSQRIRPILVDDLAKIAVTALSLPDPPTNEVAAEGAVELTLDALIRDFNGQKIRILHYPPAVLDVVFPLFPWLAYTTRTQLPRADFLIGEATCDEVLTVKQKPVAEVWTDQARKERLHRAARRRARSVYRTTRSSWLIATYLIMLGLAAAVVGLHDAFVTSTLAPRVTGILLVLAGVFMTSAGATLFARYWKHRYEAAFLGGAVASVLLTVIWAAALVNGDAPSLWRFPIGPYLIAAALGMCFALWRRGGLLIAQFLRKGGLRRVSAILLGTTAIALVQFLYGSIYVPATATPTLTITATTAPGKAVADRRPLTIEITVRNSADQAVNVLAGSYEVIAYNTESRAPLDSSKPVEDATLDSWRKSILNTGRIRMDASDSRAHLVEIGGLLSPGTFVEPGEQIKRKLVAYMPANYTTATLSIDVAVARRRFENQLSFSLDVTKAQGEPVLDAVDQIDDLSWLHKLTRGKRYIHAVGALGPKPLSVCPGGRLVVFIDNEHATDLLHGACSKRAKSMEKHYGITYTDTAVETALPSAKK